MQTKTEILKSELAALNSELISVQAENDSLKIRLNGSYGLLGSPFSTLYAPKLLIQVTITGQLALLMLIERIEAAGISVISANTDGIVSKIPRSRIAEFKAILFDWECETGFTLESTDYAALHSRDVNSYIARQMDGGIKLKGAFGPCGPNLPAAMGLKKNPAAQIAVDAAVAYLSNGTPIADTIARCTDIRQFLVVRRVTGGAADQDGVLVGKIVRWYYSTEVEGPLLYVKDGKIVPRSNGARPLMELPVDSECPDDLDRLFYVREAFAILQDVGLGATDPSIAGRSGYFFGRREKTKLLHLVDASTGVAVCGNERESIREQWAEFASIGVGQKMCPRCRKWSDL